MHIISTLEVSVASFTCIHIATLLNINCLEASYLYVAIQRDCFSDNFLKISSVTAMQSSYLTKPKTQSKVYKIFTI